MDINKAWELLNKWGIRTEEELKEALKKQKPLNIGCMVLPIKNDVTKNNQ